MVCVIAGSAIVHMGRTIAQQNQRLATSETQNRQLAREFRSARDGAPVPQSTLPDSPAPTPASGARKSNRENAEARGEDETQPLRDSLAEANATVARLEAHIAELESQLGEAGYQELADLARRASAARVRGGPTVLIVPGLMGSKLGHPGTIFDDVYWLDPIRFAFGIAQKLALDGTGDSTVEPIGVFLMVYGKLLLSLTIAGYDAAFFPSLRRARIIRRIDCRTWG